jgi:hypothetical protein
MTPARRKHIKQEQEVIVIDDSSSDEETQALTGDYLGVARMPPEEVITKGEAYWLKWMNSKDTVHPGVASKPYKSEMHSSSFKTEKHTSKSFLSDGQVTSYKTKEDGLHRFEREQQTSKKLKTEVVDNESHHDFMNRISQEDTQEPKSNVKEEPKT